MTHLDANRQLKNRLFIIIAERWLSLVERLKDRRLRGPILYTASSFVQVFTMAASGLIVARLVLPEEIGTWYSVSVLLPYLTLLSLGLPQSAGRQFAYFSGANEEQHAHEAANTAFFYTLLWSAVSVVISSGAMLIAWGEGSDSHTMLAFGLFLIVAGSNPFAQFLHNLYRNGREFGTLGIIQFVEIAYGVASIALVYFFDWTGLFVRYATITLLSATLRLYFCPVPLRLQFSWPLFRQLLKMGMPRLVISIAEGLLLAADRTLVVAKLGTEAMGFYALALLAGQAMGNIPLSLTQIMQTQMTVRYGQTKSVKSLRRLTFIPVMFNAAVLLIPTILAILLIGPFVNTFLPNYSPGIDAARLAILGGYFSALRTSGGIFGALDRLSGYMILMVGALGLFYCLGWAGLEIYGTVASVAAAKVITMVFLAIGVNLLALKYVNKGA